MVMEIIISIFLLALLGILFYGTKRYFDTKNKMIDKKIPIEYLNIEFTDDKFSLLDKIIEREFNNYMKLHPDKFDDSGNGYMNENDYKINLDAITKRVYNSLTPALKANINLVYKFDTDKDQLTIILEKVGIMLAMYRARMNSAVIDDTLNEKTTTIF